MNWTKALVIVAALAMLVLVPLSLVVAPTAADFNAVLTQRIFYYHVPSAWAAYLAFAVTAGASAWLLVKRDARADRLAAASAEVGTLFSLVALGTGLVWSGQEFLNYAPFEDPKVITLVVLILAYFAYFALRAAVEEPAQRARFAAVFGLLAFIGVPLSYLASRTSIHPDFTRPEESLDPTLGWILLYGTVAFTLLYAALVAVRVQLARVEAALEDLQQER